jgi:hypothetical protein
MIFQSTEGFYWIPECDKINNEEITFEEYNKCRNENSKGNA